MTNIILNFYLTKAFLSDQTNHKEEWEKKIVSLPREETSNFLHPISRRKELRKVEEKQIRYAEGEKKNY